MGRGGEERRCVAENEWIPWRRVDVLLLNIESDWVVSTSFWLLRQLGGSKAPMFLGWGADIKC